MLKFPATLLGAILLTACGAQVQTSGSGPSVDSGKATSDDAATCSLGNLSTGFELDSGNMTASYVAKMIAVGVRHSCALLTDGTVKCWGQNGNEQLGDGTSTDSSIPVNVSDITNAAAIAASFEQGCALLRDCTVQCWGLYGDNRDAGFTGYSTPQVVPNISDAVAIYAGQGVCVLLKGGALKCWGYNGDGELGNGSPPNDFVAPAESAPVVGISNPAALTSGYLHSCALLSDGTVHCWGGNNAGQLGNGTKTNSNMPIEVPGITNAIAIAAGGFNSCALLADGTVLCWGYNDYGQLGSLGADTCDKPTGEKVVLSVNCSTVPIIVGQFTNAAALAVDGATACVLFNGGTVRCWGDNEYGQHGNGNSGDVTATVTGLTNAVSVVSSNGHSCALLSDGRVECWGLNDFGQLGNGTTTNSPVPVTVNGF